MKNLHVFHAAVDFRSYPFKEINILTNPMVNATDKLIEKTKLLIKTTKAANVILDSGGNTIFNRERSGQETICDGTLPINYDGKVNLAPDHVIDIASKLRPTAVVSLDNPLQHRDSPVEIEKEFLRKLQINIEWARETVRLGQRLCPDVSVLIPIQARTFEQLEVFLGALSGLRIAGVSIPIRNMKPRLLVLFLTRLYQFGISWVHILGTTCFSYVAIAAYFARHRLFDVVSVDSMSWKQASNYSAFMSPHDLGSHKIDDDTIIPDTAQNDCTCPFCRNVSFESIKESVYSDRMLFLCGHNAFVIQQAADELYRNAGSLDQLERFAMHKSPNERKVPEAIDALYAAEEMKDQNINRLRAVLE